MGSSAFCASDLPLSLSASLGVLLTPFCPPPPWSCDTYRIINPNQQQTATALLEQCQQPDKDSTPHLRNNLQFYTFLLHWPKKYCIETKAMISSEKMSR